MSKTSTPPTFLDAFKSATDADLAMIDERIAELTSELDSLSAARKVIDVRLHGKKVRGGNKKAEPGTKIADQRARAARYLSMHGLSATGKLCEECNIPTGSVTAVLNHEWFTKGAGGVQLSTVGQMAMKKAS